MPGGTATSNVGEQRREFASERGHCDAQSLNDHARAAVQTAILINGGAATALLAFASEGSDLATNLVLAVGLAMYVAGVIAGAYNVRKLTGASYFAMLAWDHEARHFDLESIDGFWVEAKKLKGEGDELFTASIACFVIGSICAGFALVVV